mgnify:FL=1
MCDFPDHRSPFVMEDSPCRPSLEHVNIRVVHGRDDSTVPVSLFGLSDDACIHELKLAAERRGLLRGWRLPRQPDVPTGPWRDAVAEDFFASLDGLSGRAQENEPVFMGATYDLMPLPGHGMSPRRAHSPPRTALLPWSRCLVPASVTSPRRRVTVISDGSLCNPGVMSPRRQSPRAAAVRGDPGALFHQLEMERRDRLIRDQLQRTRRGSPRALPLSPAGVFPLSPAMDAETTETMLEVSEEDEEPRLLACWSPPPPPPKRAAKPPRPVATACSRADEYSDVCGDFMPKWGNGAICERCGWAKPRHYVKLLRTP